ncbi:MAG: ATP-dependent RecD-like DNA helicase [Spirochaetaceae bacterium]|nr:MAG: ATP-dependent RecD-like DNA helicase [Spirochaetaceae bacterium]
MTEELEGVVESLLFSSEETGYSVVRLRSGGQLLTAVGNLAAPVPGERLHLQGRWTNHPRFGRQFAVEAYESHAPATVEGIERYLASGLIPGIGAELARRIVRAFGEQTLEILDCQPQRLAEVEGIGRKRITALKSSWKQQREIRKVMIFLQSHGAGPALAAKIYKRYGDHSIAVVQDNPYRLALDMFGVGFLTADRIARAIGIAADSPERAQSGLLHTLEECSTEGHLYYPRTALIQRCQKLLEIDREIISAALESLAREGKLIVEDQPDPPVYLPAFYRAETGIALLLAELQATARAARKIDGEKAVAWVQERMDIVLAEKQLEALRTALGSKIMVITGGPGTGKTTIIRALLLILQRAGVRFLQAAPTGRAAKRMQEAGGYEAKTIHRLLEYYPREGEFKRNPGNPLDCHWLILDEASMIDALLMYHLLKALPPSSSLILVGDADQLPSVGPGCLLKDIIRCGKAPVVELNEIFRQAGTSRIVVNAHRINIGLMPEQQEEGDFFFIRQDDPEEVVRLILKLCRERIPARFGLDPVEEIQVLSPMHRGPAGVSNLNRVLQEALNPQALELVYGERCFRLGDKVMQIRNNYDKEVFNGDIGRVERIDTEARSMVVRYEDRRVRYESTDLDEIILAYAVSVHKSQGSEFPAVIIPLLTQHYLLLQRNLLYTAVTRGKRLVVLIGTKKALAIALKNTDTQERYTGLRTRLAEVLAG